VQARVSRWGNSLGIRIPVMAVEEMRLGDGEVVELTIRDGEIIIRKQQFTLDKLVSRITMTNRHSGTDYDVVGREQL